MTQEELDALMNEDGDATVVEEEVAEEKSTSEEAILEEESTLEESDALEEPELDEIPLDDVKEEAALDEAPMEEIEEESICEDEIAKEDTLEETDTLEEEPNNSEEVVDESDALEEAEEIDETLLDEIVEESDSTEEVSTEIPEDKKEEHYRAEADASWPPPPPTNDHQVVNQLDDVTKDSEIKATEIFDHLEGISECNSQVESKLEEQKKIFENNIDIFERLHVKFPNIESFKSALEENKQALADCEEMTSLSQEANDKVMTTMDVMQYQDIHRQKIERVINVMRALSGYMSSLFASNVDDNKRVGSAMHIEGDTDNDTVDEEDIEALIASFGKN